MPGSQGCTFLRLSLVCRIHIQPCVRVDPCVGPLPCRHETRLRSVRITLSARTYGTHDLVHTGAVAAYIHSMHGPHEWPHLLTPQLSSSTRPGLTALDLSASGR